MTDTANDWLSRARDFTESREWTRAAELFREAGEHVQLEGDDLQRLATCHYMQADEAAAIQWLDRAHHAHLDDGEFRKAIQCAFWCGLFLMFQGQVAQASGWFGRARRLLEQLGEECSECGYLLLPNVERDLSRGDYVGAFAAAAEAVSVGQRFEDLDLVCLAVHLQGRVRLEQEQVDEGLALLDEAMISVRSDALSPTVTGLVYCSVIKSCLTVRAFERAREWTSALALWCDSQPSLVNFTGKCLVHRAEIMRMNGSWADALDEAQRAIDRFGSDDVNRASAMYERAEVLRLTEDFDEAEKVYLEVAAVGRDPQPGLALLRNAQGAVEHARSAIRRALSSAGHAKRAVLLPAAVEIEAAVDTNAARAFCDELVQLSRHYGTTALLADAALALGRVELAESDFHAALRSLRTAHDLYERLGMPYHLAQVRLGMAEACDALEDRDASTVERQAAESILARLCEEIAAVSPTSSVEQTAGPLSRRETEVLGHVSRGETNREIAAQLFLSVRTVDRHVSNIFNKLGVSNRAEATARALRDELI